MAAELPRSVLSDIPWTLGPTTYATPEELDRVVRQRQIERTGEDSWRPRALVLPAPRIAVSFLCWRGDEQIEPRFMIESASADGFTALDLLFKLTDGVARTLAEHGARLGDRRFFEGLRAGRPGSDPPLYRVNFGS